MKRCAFIIPFRDRYPHLTRFIPHYRKRFPTIKIFVIEQANGKPFERGTLINIGYLEFKYEFDYFVCHDVDMLLNKGSYDYAENPTQLATHVEQFEYQIPCPDYFGGVTMFTNEDFEKVNGYSNKFTGWGAEDTLLYRDTIAAGLKVSYRDNYYSSLRHARPIVNEEYEHNLKVLASGKGAEDGLTSCQYKVIQRGDMGDYKMITVEI